jgi:hypothetical protein
MIVTFVYDDWLTSYPEFTTTTNDAQGEGYFAQAEEYCGNSDCAIVPYDPTASPPINTRLIILYLLTAHIAQMFAGSVVGGITRPPSPLVGRINSATQGTVTVQAEMPGPQNATAAWYNQTLYGANANAMMAKYRMARYRASPGRFSQPSPVRRFGGW